MSKNETKAKTEVELQAEALKAVEEEAKKQAELQALKEANEKTKKNEGLPQTDGSSVMDGNVGNAPAQPPVTQNSTDSKKTSTPKAEKKQKTKIADHMMKINGVYYQAGDEVPIV